MLCVGVGVIERLTDRSNETETRGGGGGYRWSREELGGVC